MQKLEKLLQLAGVSDQYSIGVYMSQIWAEHLDVSEEERRHLIRDILALYTKPELLVAEDDFLSKVIECLHYHEIEADESVAEKQHEALSFHEEQPIYHVDPIIGIDKLHLNPPCLHEILPSNDEKSENSPSLFSSIDDESLSVLTSLFPEIHLNALVHLWNQTYGDIDMAIRKLEQLKLYHSEEATEGDDKPICRHFLAGECLRHDCWYSHEFTMRTCRFWLKNACAKGNSCEFLHGFEFDEALDRSFPLEERSHLSMNIDDFPLLEEFRDNYMLSKSTAITFADQAKLAKLKEDLVHVDTCAIDDSGMTRNHFLQTSGGGRTSSLTPRTSSSKGRDDGEFQIKCQPSVAPTIWVATGDLLRTQYETLREQAIIKANLRNSLFEQATRAYISGDKSGAAKFSKQARNIDQEMRQLHWQAATIIFEERNAILNTDTMIDLHGLHKDEALYHLEERIEHLRRRDYHGYLHVISGTGHHSKSGHGSRLLPHIEHYLQNHALHYIDSSKDRRGGMISIHLR
jgi:DNA-nicking Smr family endonuclease